MSQVQRCDICYKNIISDDRAYCNSCGAEYHRTCINMAIKENNICPKCKTYFVNDKLTNTAGETTEKELYPESDSINQISLSNKSTLSFAGAIISILIMIAGMVISHQLTTVIGMVLLSISFYIGFTATEHS